MKRSQSPRHTWFHFGRILRRLDESGSLVVTLAVTLLVIGVFSVATVSFISTDSSQRVVENRGANAYYLSEGGLRIAAAIYQKAQDSIGTDHDRYKALVLMNDIDGYQFNLPNNQGAFKLAVYPYWFVVNEDAQPQLQLQLPGQVPAGFQIPASGFLKLGEELGSGDIYEYEKAAMSGNRLNLTWKKAPSLEKGNRLYVVLKATGGISNNTLTVSNPTGSRNFIPPKNGYIHAYSNKNDRYALTYGSAVYSQDGRNISLNGLKLAPDADIGDVSEAAIKKDDDVVFKKFITLSSTGILGDGDASLVSASQTVSHHIWIMDADDPANADYSPPPFQFEDKKDLRPWNSSEFNANELAIDTYQTSGGGTGVYASFNNVPTRDENNRNYGYGSLCLWNTESTHGVVDFSNAWLSNNRKLDYDVQVKISTGNALMHGAAGITLRNRNEPPKKENDPVPGRIGVSFVKYFEPFIPFNANGRTIPLKQGDTIKSLYWWGGVRASAVIKAPPLVTRGSWPLGNAQGETRIQNVTGAFQYGDNLIVNNEARSSIKILNDETYVKNYWTVINDFLPNSIKPPENGQEILVVLWEEKGIRNSTSLKRRWLAYKRISLDRYVIGDQDYKDGNVVNDDATLLVQIRERYEGKVKVNRINVFYGDQTRRSEFKTGRVKNTIPYDIEGNRGEYARAIANFPIWPPRFLEPENWDNEKDLFTHIQDKEITIHDGITYDCDWTLNTAVTTGYDNPTFIFKKDINGTLILSDFTTPEIGPQKSDELYYRYEHEGDVCLHGLGDVEKEKDRFAIIGFTDFALKFPSTSNPNRGAFGVAIQE